MSYMDRSALMKALSSLDGGGVKEGDLMFEVGNGAFADTETNFTVATKLNKIKAGFVVPFDSYQPATDLAGTGYILSVRPDVTEDTNSHRKTFEIYRNTGGLVEALKFCYIVFGNIYDTA